MFLGVSGKNRYKILRDEESSNGINVCARNEKQAKRKRRIFKKKPCITPMLSGLATTLIFYT